MQYTRELDLIPRRPGRRRSRFGCINYMATTIVCLDCNFSDLFYGNKTGVLNVRSSVKVNGGEWLGWQRSHL